MESLKSSLLPPDTPAPAGPPSPASPGGRKPSRRSSVAASRRVSQAGGGAGMVGDITLTDRLAAVPTKDEATIRQRLDKLVALCVNTTLRQVEMGAQEEEGDLEETAKEVGRNVMHQFGLGDAVMEAVASKIEGGLVVSRGEHIGETRRKVLEYTAVMKEEIAKWGEVKVERKEQLKRAERNSRQAEKGEICIGEDQRFVLCPKERAKLDAAADAKEAALHLRRHRERQEQLVMSAATLAVRMKRKYEDVDSELVDGVKELIQRADKAGGRLEKMGPEVLLQD